MENIGWIGSLLLALCGLPQAIESFKNKHSNGLTWGFILMWFIGEICTFVYIIPKMDFPLLVNYSANICFLIIIIYFKIYPKK
jgi:uncharacterized protein with PQ loop repeat